VSVRILDFGAGYRAMHTLRMRELGLDVTAHDFGRNFVPGLHAEGALRLPRFDVVMLSNVVNVHCTLAGLELTIAQAAGATAENGVCVVNYPHSPRKYPTIDKVKMAALLGQYFSEVATVAGKSCPLWECRCPKHGASIVAELNLKFCDADFESATIRPVGAVGAGALVPRHVLDLLSERIEQL
jgi:hypothetical protein